MVDKKISTTPSFFKTDSSILHGVLENGVTYYIRANSFDAKKASLRLAVKAGSIHEEEDQRGMAHFIEHMVFRGTKSFKDGEAIKYLESVGASFGAHTNAYTTFNETVYLLDLPLSEKNVLENAIQILSEFAFEATFEPSLIEIEKGVVLDELRRLQSSSQKREQQMLLKEVFEKSLYSIRFPIGLEDKINNFDQESLINFYKKWYTPSNLAIIITLDFDPNKTLSLVKKYFQSCYDSFEKKNFIFPSIEGFDELKAKVLINKESACSKMYFAKWCDKIQEDSLEGQKVNLLMDLLSICARRRFEITANQEDSPFKSANAFCLKSLHERPLFLLLFECWDKKAEFSFQCCIDQFKHCALTLFSHSEFELAKEKSQTFYENELKNINTRKNSEYCSYFVSHFTKGAPLISFEEFFSLRLQMLSEISLKELQDHQVNLFNPKSFNILFFPSKENELVTQDMLKSLVENKSLKPLDPKCNHKKELTSVTFSKKGEILSRSYFDSTNLHQYSLSNGMSVYLKKTDLKKESISIFLTAENGLNLFSEKLYACAKVAPQYVEEAGLSGLTSIELKDALSGRLINFTPFVSLKERGVVGCSSSKDLCFFLKLVFALFKERNSSTQAFNKLCSLVDQRNQAEELNSEARFFRVASQLKFKDHYAFSKIKSENISQNGILSALESLFSDPSQFSLILVGDFELESIEELLKEYVASLTGNKIITSVLISDFDCPLGIFFKEVKSEATQGQCNCEMSFKINARNQKLNLESFYYFFILEHILNARLIQSLRQDLGEVYSICCSTQFPLYPDLFGSRFNISFATHAAHFDLVKERILNEIRILSSSGVKQNEVETAKEIGRHLRAKSSLTNEGQIHKIVTNINFKKSFDRFEYDLLDEINIDPNKLHQVIKDVFDLNRYTICKRG